ncbi:MAG TPA: carboxypeptidase-like regulatory domain-containing protein [Pyrinomonadaceae bacterium]|nr:carboxypeptidase-like regulatory domain-containing protein [Pyrinomonadaceae bacterium]
MKSGRLSILLAAAGLTLALAGRAGAECVYDPAPPCQAYWSAGAVFVGTVKEVAYSATYQRGAGNDRWNYRRRTTRFSVETAYKGVEGKLVEVVTEQIMPTPVVLPDGGQGTKAMSHSDCDYKFDEGETYFVYANFNAKKDGTLVVPMNRTRKLRDAAADTEFVNELPRLAPTGKIFGRIVRSDRNPPDGKHQSLPLAGIKVTARGAEGTYEALTDAEGNFGLKDVPPGSYQVTPDYPAHLSSDSGSRLARVIARGCAHLDFYTYADARIKGRVLDAEGRPLPEVKVDLIPADGSETSSRGVTAFTNQEGLYELKAIPAGRFLLGLNLSSAPNARAPYPRTYYPGVGSAARATVIAVAEGAQLPSYDLQLPPPLVERVVEVVVTWPDGRPVSDALPRLEDPAYPWGSGAMSVKKVEGQEGRYQLTGFDGITYWAHAYVNLKGGQARAEPVKFTLKEGAPPINLVIASPGGNSPHHRRK